MAFQTGYLKANYPAEYMAAVLSRNLDDITKLSFYMDECKAMGINVKGPDINESEETFSVSAAGDVRFGLSAIKGIGTDVVRRILDERAKGGPFKDIYDFVERVPAQGINRRVFDGLALSGAFDCFTTNKREDLVAEIGKRGETAGEILLRYGARHQHEAALQTNSLFGFDDDEMLASSRPSIPPAPAWAPLARLDKERELVGMYLSAHPLDPFRVEVEHGVDCTTVEKNEISSPSAAPITFAGMVMELTEKTFGNGGSMTIVKVEDFSGTTDFAMFDRQRNEFGGMCSVGNAILVTGRFKPDKRGGVRFYMERVEPLESARRHLFKGLTLKVVPDQLHLLEEIVEKYSSGKAKDGDNLMDLDIVVEEPEIGRSLRFGTPVHMPLSRRLLKELEAADVEFNIERNYTNS